MRPYCPHCSTRLPKKWHAAVIDEGYVLCECGTKVVFRFSQYWGVLVMGIFAGVFSYVDPQFGMIGQAKSLMVGVVYGLVSLVIISIIRLPAVL